MVERDHGLVNEVGEAEEQDHARHPPAMRAREARVGGDGEDEPQRDEDRPGEADEVRRAPEVHVLSDVHVPPLVERSADHGQEKSRAAQPEPGGGAVASPPPGERPRTDEAVGCDAGVHEDVRGREEAVAADRPVPSCHRGARLSASVRLLIDRR